jgi:hypothetical protein
MWNLILIRLVTVLVSVCLDIVLVSVQDWCTICAKHTIGSKMIFDALNSNSKVTRLKWKLVLVRLKIVLILTKDRCMVCTEHTTGSKIILDAPDGTTR